MKTSKEIAEEIFYSPATNGQAAISIANGIKLIEEYAAEKIRQSANNGFTGNWNVLPGDAF